MGRQAALQQLIATVQRRWGTRALRRLGEDMPRAVAALPTGFAALDAALGIGGLPRSQLTELLGTPTSGAITLALTMLARAQAAGDLAGYVDLSRTFDAEIAALLGVDLAALLLVRPAAGRRSTSSLRRSATRAGKGEQSRSPPAMNRRTTAGSGVAGAVG